MDLTAKARATNNAGAHETQGDASWGHIPSEQRTASKSNVDIYLDDLISVVQGGPRERRQMLRHFFHQIDRVFRPKEKAETNCKYPIFLKKLGKGHGEWSTRKTVIGWYLYTISHLLRLPPRQQ